MVARVKSYKAGYVTSDSNVRPDQTLEEVIALSEKTGHSTCAVTEDGTAHGKLVGIITSKDFRITHCKPNSKVSEYMTPLSGMTVGHEGITLSEANELIWEKKVNQLPVVDKDGNLENVDALKKAIGTEWSEYKVTTVQKKQQVGNPPSGNNGSGESRARELYLNHLKQQGIKVEDAGKE